MEDADSYYMLKILRSQSMEMCLLKTTLIYPEEDNNATTL
jgi:hypothetical protein